MPDLLLELYSEEIPARMQMQAQENLKKLVTDKLVDAGLTYEGAKAFSTPRRLALAVNGLLAKSKDVREEKKGPRVGAPERAIEGFLKSAGLKSISEAKVQEDKKGNFYIAVIEKKGRAAEDVIAEIVPEIVRAFPWPKSMRWGTQSAVKGVFDKGVFDSRVFDTGSFHWVRPLHSIVCTFGPETEEPEIVRFEVGGVKSGDITHGHPVMAPGAIKVKRLEDYLDKLDKAKVIADRDRRKAIIQADAKNLALAQGLELVEDEGLLDEVAGLVEWPVVLLGEFDKSYLDIPPEVIRATIRANQKCFVLRDAQGKLANKFILVSNLEAKDGGAAIKAGNARVIRARLADAKFFWDQDRKTKLEDRLPKFFGITFHEKLGTQAERIERIARLAKELAPIVKADPAKAERAARLAKLDLVTDMVGEFPELQGLMGKYYAINEKIDTEIANALEEHYKPQGPGDRVPTAPVSIAVALADKIDTLVGFWAIDEKPTGSKDPYALRRAALGIIRLIVQNNLRIPLTNAFAHGIQGYKAQSNEAVISGVESWAVAEDSIRATVKSAFDAWTAGGIRHFMSDRLKQMLRDQGARHDLVDAVFALDPSFTSPLRGEVAARSVAGGGERAAHPTSPLAEARGDPPPQGEGQMQDDLLMIVRRVEALGKFLATDDGKNLLAGYKRAANILGIEEKKDKKNYSGEPDARLLKEPEEKTLADAIQKVEGEVSAALKKEDFEAVMSAISKLRAPVDAFFEKVTVNAEDKALRENRLKLLNRIREATRHVADFSRIAG